VFIFWGEYDKAKSRGMVADRCKGCGELTVMRVSHIYQVSHVYLIPLGSGKLRATVAECTECGHKAPFRDDKYPRLVPEEEADSLTITEVLRQTNPRLAKAKDEREQLERQATANRRATPGTPDPRVKLAFTKLAEIDNENSKAIDLQARLAQWSALRPRDQDALLSDIDALVSAHEQRDSVRRFISAMGQRFEPAVDGTASFLTFLGLIIGGIALAVSILPPQLRAVGLIVAFALAVGIATVVQAQYKRYVFKRFFRDTFLRQAKKRRIDVGEAVAALQDVDPGDSTLSDGLRAMAKRKRFLQEVLDQEGISV
jgi:hypothetical protein